MNYIFGAEFSNAIFDGMPTMDKSRNTTKTNCSTPTTIGVI